MHKIIRKSYDYALNIDVFSTSLTLTYHGHKHYRTLIGTIFTVVIFTVTAFYGVSTLKKMIDKSQSYTNIGTRSINYAEEPLNATFINKDQYIAFSWTAENGEIDLISK